MNKPIWFFLVILVVLVFSIPASAEPVDEPVRIIPWFAPQVVEISSDQEVELAGRFGACGFGLAKAAQKKITFEWTLDGEPLLGPGENNSQFWYTPIPVIKEAPCLNGSDTIWHSYWVYPLGLLEVGDHVVRIIYSIDHPLTDGTDVDGDGKPEMFLGTLYDNEFIIRVTEPD